MASDLQVDLEAVPGGDGRDRGDDPAGAELQAQAFWSPASSAACRPAATSSARGAGDTIWSLTRAQAATAAVGGSSEARAATGRLRAVRGAAPAAVGRDPPQRPRPAGAPSPSSIAPGCSAPDCALGPPLCDGERLALQNALTYPGAPPA